jgi:hypothetical protein
MYEGGNVFSQHNVFAQDHTIKSRGRLLHRMRMERLSPVYFFVFRVYRQSSSENRVALEMEHDATFFITRIKLVARARTSTYVQPYVSFGQHGSGSD